MKIAAALDSIFYLGASKTPAQLEAEKWLQNNPEEFASWYPNLDYDDAYSEGPPSKPPELDPVVSGADLNWPESVGHPADFHPVLRAAGYELSIPRHDNSGAFPHYYKSSESPVEGGSSGSHRIRPTGDPGTPWSGLNTYGPWSGGVGSYRTVQDAVGAEAGDRDRYAKDVAAGRLSNL